MKSCFKQTERWRNAVLATLAPATSKSFSEPLPDAARTGKARTSKKAGNSLCSSALDSFAHLISYLLVTDPFAAFALNVYGLIDGLRIENILGAQLVISTSQLTSRSRQLSRLKQLLKLSVSKDRS